MSTTGSENSEDCGHSQQPTSEGEAGHAKQQEGHDVQDTMQGLPCVYIGETGRTLKKHLSEHKAEVNKSDPKSGIAVHA